MRNTMRRSLALAPLASVATAVFSSAALAHVGDHSQAGLAAGFAHPFGGLDHLLAMIAVGLWASQLGGRALWVLPVTFPAVMAAGAALGIGGASSGWVEAGIAASALVLGAMIAFKARPSLVLSVPLIGLFALLHGYAHGVELPADASALAYGAGFIAATAALHAVGIALGFAASRAPAHFARAAGGAIACAGLALLVLPH
jgi:urease accessory protein